MRYGPRVGRGVPLDFNFVTGFGCADCLLAWDDVAIYVAGYVI